MYKFGVREAANVVFKAIGSKKIGDTLFEDGEPVIYFDSAKTSTVESASTTVYAAGGRSNPNRIAWEGDKTATFTFEEALLSPLGFSILSGANLIESVRTPFHQNIRATVSSQDVTLGDATTPASLPVLDLSSSLSPGAQVLGKADENLIVDNNYTFPQAKIFVMKLDNGEVVERIPVNQAGALTTAPANGEQSLVLVSRQDVASSAFATETFYIASGYVDAGETKVHEQEHQLEYGGEYLVDFYALENGSELSVSASKFAGYYYIEADVLFRRESDGKDLPAQFTIPKGKVQSNFTFTMSGSGDPSTFTFTVDAFPEYTRFDRKCKTLFTLAIADNPVDGGDC